MRARFAPLVPLAWVLACTGGVPRVTGDDAWEPGESSSAASSAGDEGDGPGETAADASTGTSDPSSSDGEGSTSSSAGEESSTGGGPWSPPAGTECEYAFFSSYFDDDNGLEHAELRDASFDRMVERTEDLWSCGAGVTLGGMLSLMIFEGGGARIGFFNDLCDQNSYSDSPTCWTEPLARYSYQYGIAPVHTSNFHPCADPGWTQMMRARLAEAMSAAGFAPTDDEIASVAGELASFCPGTEPTIVDYYILSAHAVFGVPTDAVGNDLANAGTYPFFTPRVMIDLFYDTFEPSCAALGSDEAAIAVFGGADPTYDDPAKQALILALWHDWQAAHCPP